MTAGTKLEPLLKFLSLIFFIFFLGCSNSIQLPPQLLNLYPLTLKPAGGQSA